MLIVVLLTVSQASFAYCIVTSTFTWNKTSVSCSMFFSSKGHNNAFEGVWNWDDVSIREEGVYSTLNFVINNTVRQDYFVCIPIRSILGLIILVKGQGQSREAL